jgi:hypothetical protein
MAPTILAEPPAAPVLAMRMDVAARAVGLSTSYMKRLVAAGRVKTVTFGRARLITVDALREMLNGQ